MHALDSWFEEKRSAWLYQRVAAAEPDPQLQQTFLNMAHAAEKQAGIWADAAYRQGHLPPAHYHPDRRTQLVGQLLKVFGPRTLTGLLAAMKVRGMSLYRYPGHGLTRPGVLETQHRTPGSGNLRAAVFGINDGLVSNAALILGVAGAGAAPEMVLLTGLAGLLAGAGSMAAGEYISVRTQREFYEYQIDLEAEELELYPQEEAAELALIYEAKGIPRDEAIALATRLVADPKQALDTLAREELGLNPAELGSPWGAGLSSFAAFSLGAALPLLPWWFSDGAQLPFTLAVSGTALFAIGAAISLFTGRGALRGGLRMLAIGAAAGGLTWLVGRLLGVSLG
jgi:VIT1/CCC1 family predicted Fe2+/Mn2+ transporter